MEAEDLSVQLSKNVSIQNGAISKIFPYASAKPPSHAGMTTMEDASL
jgi:hypothetical protein